MWYRRAQAIIHQAQENNPEPVLDKDVDQTQHIDFVDNGPDSPSDADDTNNPFVTRQTPTIQGYQARLHSPNHTDPVITPMEESLETARHSNNSGGNPGVDPAAISSNDARGYQAIRGVPQAERNQGVIPSPNSPSSFTLN